MMKELRAQSKITDGCDKKYDQNEITFYFVTDGDEYGDCQAFFKRGRNNQHCEDHGKNIEQKQNNYCGCIPTKEIKKRANRSVVPEVTATLYGTDTGHMRNTVVMKDEHPSIQLHQQRPSYQHCDGNPEYPALELADNKP
jgi:hypothetical protein